MNTSIHTPTPEQEQPQLGVTSAIAIGFFAIGLAAITLWPAAVPPAPEITSARATRSVSADSDPTAATAPSETPSTTGNVEPSTNTDTPAKADAATTERLIAPARPEAATHSTTTQPGKASSAPSTLTVIQGRVAYLRCDGLRNEGGRFPCPRDTALEQSVWDVLSTLPQCVPSLGRGGTDIRLDLGRDQRSEVRVLPLNSSPEPALDTALVYACVGSRLAKLKTTLDPIYMMVSFRASLR